MITQQQARSQSNELSRLERTALEDEDPSRIQQAVSARGHEMKSAVRNTDKVWFATYLLVFLGLGGCVVLLGRPVAFLESESAVRIQGFLRGAMAMVVALALAHAVDVYAVGRIPNAASRFNLRRVVRLLAGLVLALIALSVLFANWKEKHSHPIGI